MRGGLNATLNFTQIMPLEWREGEREEEKEKERWLDGQVSGRVTMWMYGCTVDKGMDGWKGWQMGGWEMGHGQMHEGRVTG